MSVNEAIHPSAGYFPDEQEWVEVGEVIGSVGVTRTAKISSADALPDWLEGLQRLWMSFPEGKLPKKKQGQWLHVESCTPFEAYKLTLVAKEWQSPEAIKAWRGAKLFIPKASLPAIEAEDTFRTFDLVGLSVYIESCESPVAVVTALSSSTRQEEEQVFLELTMQASGKLVFVPFEKHFVKLVDLAGKSLYLQGLDDFLQEENTVIEKAAKKLTPYAKRKLKRQAEKEKKAHHEPHDPESPHSPSI